MLGDAVDAGGRGDPPLRWGGVMFVGCVFDFGLRWREGTECTV